MPIAMKCSNKEIIRRRFIRQSNIQFLRLVIEKVTHKSLNLNMIRSNAVWAMNWCCIDLLHSNFTNCL